ncbi:hypothetical protein [Nonomuraea dietziae]|uniref:hypothetical protein n=1 Tax=Nonomuraea dietziae TaxID=65515 RepID=UPI0031CE871D
MTSPDDDLEAELMALADFVDLPAAPPPAEVAAAVRGPASRSPRPSPRHRREGGPGGGSSRPSRS